MIFFWRDLPLGASHPERQRKKKGKWGKQTLHQLRPAGSGHRLLTPSPCPPLKPTASAWDGPACRPGPAQPGGLLCKRWGGGRRRFLLLRPLQPQKPPSPRCVRNCLEAGASCRCPALMNHTLSGLGVPNGRATTKMPPEPCPGMHPPPHHTILARRGLSRH